MVVKLILDAGGDHIAKIWRAITVATPFYGYGGQLHRFFKGEPYLNWYYGTSRMAQIISSMLGVYTLQFLDYDTYRRDKGLLEKEPDYPLRDYPSRVAQSRAPADPCNPTQQANSFRYPTADWFKRAELEHARGIYRQVAVPLTDPAVRRTFYNFRGFRYRNGTLIKDTVNSQTWGWVQRDFDPDRSGSPITDDPGGPGDDTIPAWSARLASTPADNVRTLKGTINHMFLMDAGRNADRTREAGRLQAHDAGANPRRARDRPDRRGKSAEDARIPARFARGGAPRARRPGLSRPFHPAAATVICPPTADGYDEKKFLPPTQAVVERYPPAGSLRQTPGRPFCDMEGAPPMPAPAR